MIGVGNISGQYLEHLPHFDSLELVAVADLDRSRAASTAAAHGVRALDVEELLASPDIDAVLNLTIPAAHVDVALRALAAGKHVYSEKPFGLTTASALELVAPRADGLRVGSAPDTVLGTGVQTARRALDDGLIGDPVGASVHWSSAGHERWHPSPAFYYQPGGGPLFDMGPYYLTSLVTLFGPVVRVAGFAGRSSRLRRVEQGPQAGSPVPVDVDTHVTALLEHANGATSTVVVSFEIWATKTPLFEVYGTSGTLLMPDPNQFSDSVSAWTVDDPEWRTVVASAGYRDAGRGVGLADMAAAISQGTPHRASGELAFHVLEIMEAVLAASAERRVVELSSTVGRPAAVPLRDLDSASWRSQLSKLGFQSDRGTDFYPRPLIDGHPR
ncbi:putative dehydrogenase [Demequina lutea]|uniref:Putative dehydrogenase n=2 Tax=Demequina lutea TaxID=431489 RepID=A0A7Z0CL78_9MICO|nr:putative dehydrogenase [Demequina lutea]